MIKSPTRVINPAKIGWAAGIIDGEGCIRIAKRKRINRPDEYAPLITIQMVDLRTILEVRSILSFQGRIYEYQRKQANRRLIYIIEARNEIAFRMLEVLLPYLITKKKQAAVVLA